VPPPDRDLAAPVLAVAHRAGNSPAALRAATALGAHLAEADIHLHRGRLEVRHGRPVGRLPLLLDGWRLSPSLRPLLLEAVLQAAPAAAPASGQAAGPVAAQGLGRPGPALMLDLKGAGRPMGEQVRDLLARHPGVRPVVACAARWEALAPLAELDRVLPALSAGSAEQLGRLHDQLRPDRPVQLVSVDHRLLTPEVTRRLHEQVPVVLAWTVNRVTDLPRLLALRESGRIGVISDSAAVLARVLAEAGR
jgi:hypothetical protein